MSAVTGTEREIRAPELIAPAGDWDCVRAAVENGADAIYFGLERHNARMRAANFTLAGLPELMAFLHRRGVHGYVTFNTLIFPGEMKEAETWLRGIIAAGADAAIVQDAGICRLIRRLSPDFPIHASTQMTITSAAGVRFARALGCSVVIIARECSIGDITRIRGELASDDTTDDECRLEVFIHGALCVAYSGQCLTSESLGGRSANRGVCAQACRMPYDLVADGSLVPLGDRRYLLSPRDLAGLEVLPDLIRAGVSALKIEGRLKSPEYVANMTRVYRNAIDRVCASLSGTDRQTPESESAIGSLVRSLAEEARYDMEMAFSRGLYTGWLKGTNNQELVHARFGKKRGVLLGEVTRVSGDSIYARLLDSLKPGDGVVFDAGKPDEEEEGGRVYGVHTRGIETRLEFGRGDLKPGRIRAGDKIWKTSDPELSRRLLRSFSGDRPHFQRPVDFVVGGRAGRKLELVARDRIGHEVRLESEPALAPAANRPVTDAALREQLGRLGGSQFTLGELDNRLEGELMLPVSELNRLRREAVRQLDELRARAPAWTVAGAEACSRLETKPAGERTERGLPEAEPPPTADLVLLVRSMAQLEAVLKPDIAAVYCEFEDPKKYREAVARFRRWKDETGSCLPADIWVAPPRICKPGEEWILRLVRSSGADGYLVRNYDHLKYFADFRRSGDYSLNVANALSAEHFIMHFGLERVTASYDLNAEQLEDLLRSAPPSWFEVTVHQHMPMFHMEHCLFCAFLSEGTDYTNCGRPCDYREVRLRDRVGAEHHVKADAGCRNTVFNALAQTGAESVSRLMRFGARRFRIEFVDERAEDVAEITDHYRRLLRGDITGAHLWRQLKLQSQLGVTRGSANL